MINSHSTAFDDHLSVCERCADRPFNPCPTGARLLRSLVDTDIEQVEHPETGESYLLRSDPEQGVLIKRQDTASTYESSCDDGWLSLFDVDLPTAVRLVSAIARALSPASRYSIIVSAIADMLARDYYQPAIVDERSTAGSSDHSYHIFGA